MSLFDDALDALNSGMVFVRMVYGGDPPPAAPPHPDARWSKYEDRWIESDEALRKRIKESLARVRP